MQPRGIIVIEGADAAGKTTLARHLIQKYGARYLHSIVRKDIWRYHLGALRWTVKLANTQLVILDRHWLSEQAYGQTFRGAPAYDAAARCFDRVIQRCGITVLCVPKDLKRQLARHADLKTKRPEKFGNISRVAQLYYDLRFGNVAQPGNTYLDQLIRFGDYTTRPDVLVYDVDEDGPAMVTFTDKIVKRLQTRHATQLPIGLNSDHYNFTGHVGTAKTLILGESVSPQVRPGWPRWPFTWDDSESAASYLNRALQLAGHDETTTIFMNAVEPGHRHYVELVYLSTGRTLRVVALGETAARYCDEYRIPLHDALPHPQYWRRFRHKQVNDYADALRGALR